MDALFVEVRRNRVAGQPGDDLLCSLENGLMYPVCAEHGSRNKNREKWHKCKELFNGMVAWAVVKGRSQRFKVMFEVASGEFVFPEKFRRNAIVRKDRRAALRRAEKLVRDQRLSTVLHMAHDSSERSDVHPDDQIVPFMVKLGRV